MYVQGCVIDCVFKGVTDDVHGLTIEVSLRWENSRGVGGQGGWGEVKLYLSVEGEGPYRIFLSNPGI